MKLKEQGRRDGVGRLCPEIDGIHGQRIDQLQPRDRQPGRHDVARHCDRVLYAGKGTARRQDFFGDRMQAQFDTCDGPEGSFGPDKKSRQIIARHGFSGAPASMDDATVGKYNFQPHDVRAHVTVHDRLRSRSAGRRHAAQTGICAGIYRKEQSGLAQSRIKCGARDTGVHLAVHVRVIYRVDFLHLRGVQRDTTTHGVDVAFHRRTRAEGHNRNAVPAAYLVGLDHIGGRLGEDDSIRQRRCMPAFIMSMMVKHIGCCAQPVRKTVTQCVKRL